MACAGCKRRRQKALKVVSKIVHAVKGTNNGVTNTNTPAPSVPSTRRSRRMSRKKILTT